MSDQNSSTGELEGTWTHDLSIYKLLATVLNTYCFKKKKVSWNYLLITGFLRHKCVQWQSVALFLLWHTGQESSCCMCFSRQSKKDKKAQLFKQITISAFYVTEKHLLFNILLYIHNWCHKLLRVCVVCRMNGCCRTLMSASVNGHFTAML